MLGTQAPDACHTMAVVCYKTEIWNGHCMKECFSKTHQPGPGSVACEGAATFASLENSLSCRVCASR